jgi:copper chaperone CopZ
MMESKKDESSGRWAVFGSLGAAAVGAVCCLGPVVLVSLGVTGAWIGNLSALETYRPFFMVMAAGFLGFGFYRGYGRSKQEECDDGAECEVSQASLANRISLWIATVAVIGLFASPYLLSFGLEEVTAQSTPPESSKVNVDKSSEQPDKVELRTTVLKVEGMTCGGCVRTIHSTLKAIDGVNKVQVSLEPPQAKVTYDTSKVSVDDLTKATGNVGYPSEPKN